MLIMKPRGNDFLPVTPSPYAITSVTAWRFVSIGACMGIFLWRLSFFDRHKDAEVFLWRTGRDNYYRLLPKSLKWSFLSTWWPSTPPSAPPPSPPISSTRPSLSFTAFLFLLIHFRLLLWFFSSSPSSCMTHSSVRLCSQDSTQARVCVICMRRPTCISVRTELADRKRCQRAWQSKGSRDVLRQLNAWWEWHHN